MRFPLALVAVVTLPLVACSAATPATSSSTSPQSSSAAGCISAASARQVWTMIDTRLNAIILDPKHAGLSDVATGQALTGLQQYIQDNLVAKGFTEREVDTLDSLTVTNAGCNDGPLRVTIRTTLKQDDYLRSNGAVDHSDAAVGTQQSLDETFVRDNGVWKEADVNDSGAASPSSSGAIV